MSHDPDLQPNTQPAPRRRAFRFAVRGALLAAVTYFLLVPLVRRIDDAADRLREVDPSFLVAGVALQVVALGCYSAMTRQALGVERATIGLVRLFGIQLSTRAVTSAVPGGVAAGPALGYRLLTKRGVSGHGASAALTSAALGSALVLNIILWFALVASIPMYGFRPLYALAALFGIVLMMIIAAVLAALIDGSSILDRPWAFLVGHIAPLRDRGSTTDLHDDQRSQPVAPLSVSIRGFGERIESLLTDRRTRSRVLGWAAANWLVDAASLWLFLRALGEPVHPVGLLVAFGVANVLAAVPVSPGGVGVVEWAYIPILVTFGAGIDQATLAVVAYRLAQWAFPIFLGSAAYVALRVDDRLSARQPFATSA